VADPLEQRPSPQVLTFPKTLELEQRLARAEGTITELRETIVTNDATTQELRDTVSALYRRVVSLQAQLDHLLGKIQPF
jgi:uncharacterized coiled-coil protein SlyX